MFIGHFAVGLAAKKMVPEVSLGTCFVAAQFLDLLWPLLLIAGVETVRVDPGNTVVTPLDFVSYPYSHSLLTVLGWGVLFYLVYKYIIKGRRKAAVVLGLVVVSHWVLDLFTHRPDLPLAPGGDIYAGLGLWNSLPATLVVEGLIFACGSVLYLLATRPMDKIGSLGTYGLLALLVIAYLGNLFGPPPVGVDSVTIGLLSNLQWLFVLLAWWVDRHRRARGG